MLQGDIDAFEARLLCCERNLFSQFDGLWWEPISHGPGCEAVITHAAAVVDCCDGQLLGR